MAAIVCPVFITSIIKGYLLNTKFEDSCIKPFRSYRGVVFKGSSLTAFESGLIRKNLR